MSEVQVRNGQKSLPIVVETETKQTPAIERDDASKLASSSASPRSKTARKPKSTPKGAVSLVGIPGKYQFRSTSAQGRLFLLLSDELEHPLEQCYRVAKQCGVQPKLALHYVRLRGTQSRAWDIQINRRAKTVRMTILR